MHGTDILVKTHNRLENIQTMPSGTAISENFHVKKLDNVYAQSGTNRLTEQEFFYNTELTQSARSLG
jgi:hypothetical protein